MSKYLITIVGPTAIGKTSLAIKLARKYNFNYKIFVTNNRKLTFEKIQKKLVSYKINTKNIIHYY